MAMITNSKTLAITLLFLGTTNLNAQDIQRGTTAEESEQERTPEFIQDSQAVPVAEEDIDDGDDFLVSEATDEQALAREFGLFKQLMQDKVYDEADTVAKRVVELAIRTTGAQSNELAKALTNLAIVQHQTKQYDAAQQNFQAAIEIIEDNEDRLNAQLVNPLQGLGASQLEAGRPDLASATYTRAVHVTHVNEGPHNLEQVQLLESLAEINLRMGDMEGAKQVQDTIYALSIREYQRDTLQLVPALMRRGAWQHRAGFIYDERATYRRVIRIIEDAADKNDLQLVEPLILLGQSYFFLDLSGDESYQSSRGGSGEIYFRRAVRIATENPDSSWPITAEAVLALGDYYIYADNSQRGSQAYGVAWDLLSEDESRIDVRRQQLERIIPLRQQKLRQFVNPADATEEPLSDDPLLQGKISMTYDISVRGHATKIKMIEAEPAEFTDMQRHVQREMRRRLYRPRFEEGEAVPTPDQLLVHTFYYRQSDLDSIRATAADSKSK